MLSMRELLSDALKEDYEGNESLTHKRLREELSSIAIDNGYCFEYTDFPKGKIPDVLLHDGSNHLFIGDAKVAANETVNNAETIKRISGYIATFFQLMKEGRIVGGIIAINTDDVYEAKQWQKWLDLEFEKKGFELSPTNCLNNIPYQSNIACIAIS